MKKLTSFEKAIIAFCALLILAHFVASFFPEQRLWGINHLAYFPIPFRIIVTLLPLLLFIPKVNLKIQDLVEKILAFGSNLRHEKKYLWHIGMVLLFLFLFLLLRDRTHFLGDGHTQISYLETGFPRIKWTEPLEIFLHIFFHDFLNAYLKVSAESTYIILSFLSGIVFIFLLFSFSSELGKTKFEKLSVFLLMLLLGGSQLFFGYAEHYTRVYVGVFLYLAFSLRFFKGKASILILFLIFSVTVGFHFSAFYLFPSFIFINIQRLRIKNWTKWLILLLVILLSLPLTFFISKVRVDVGEIFVPLLEGTYFAPYYTIFSFSHILDIINEQLLLSPFGLVLLMALVFLFRSNIKWKDNAIIFLILVSVSQLAYHLLIDPKIGAPRDWDLFSATALGYSVLGIYLFVKNSKKISHFKYLALILVFTTFFSTLPWILINANTANSVERFKTILRLDPKRSKTGHYVLRLFYKKHGMEQEFELDKFETMKIFPEITLVDSAVVDLTQGRTDDAIKKLEKAIEINPYNYDAYDNLGVAYMRKSRLRDAVSTLTKAIKLNPLKPLQYRNLGETYLGLGEIDSAIKNYEMAKKREPNDFVTYSRLGLCYQIKGAFEKAVDSYRKALDLNPDFVSGYYSLGALLLKLNQVDDAIICFSQAVELKPEHALARFGLGSALAKKGLKKEAIKQLELYLNLSPDTTRHNEVKSLIQKLKD